MLKLWVSGIFSQDRKKHLIPMFMAESHFFFFLPNFEIKAILKDELAL